MIANTWSAAHNGFEVLDCYLSSCCYSINYTYPIWYSNIVLLVYD